MLETEEETSCYWRVYSLLCSWYSCLFTVISLYCSKCWRSPYSSEEEVELKIKSETSDDSLHGYTPIKRRNSSKKKKKRNASKQRQYQNLNQIEQFKQERKPLWESGALVEVLPEGHTLWEKGRVIDIGENDTFLVQYSKGFNGTKITERFEADRLRKSSTKLTSRTMATLKTIEEDGYMDVLLDGRKEQKRLKEEEEEEVESGPDAVEVVKILCELICSEYSDVLSDDGGALYCVDLGMYAARALSLNIVEYLCEQKYRWKVECFRCISNEINPIWMFRNTTHHHLVHDESNNNSRISSNWLPRHFTKSGFITVFCDECNMEMHDHDFTFRCSNAVHDICLKCFNKKFERHQFTLSLLKQCLRDTLNDDCIFEIACFVEGYVLKFSE